MTAALMEPASFAIRVAGRDDAPATLDLYRRAFPEEDLTGLVGALLALPGVLSLIATDGPAILGHVACTPCAVADGEGTAVLLGPLAVAVGRQREGVGSALVREGVRRLAATGATQVQVLGDPAYYGRFGFEPDPDLAPPYAIPEDWRDAWRRLPLGDAPPLAGVLVAPAPWRRPELWAG